MTDPTTHMNALVKEGPQVAVRLVPRPRIVAPDDVLIRVMLAGICRTDIYVAEGRIPARDPLVLGHEFSGVISEVGPVVRDLVPGDRVAVMPVIPCGRCTFCQTGEAPCPEPAMLGIHRHGAFAEFVSVPKSAVHRLPDTVSFAVGAYAEPTAAALAVLAAGLVPGQRGLIYGKNRIALLTGRVLAAHGFSGVVIHDPAQGPLPRNAYDFIIETVATTEALGEMIAAVRPRGLIVLKSRPCQPVALHLPVAVRKELTFRAVNYAPFAEALLLLADGRIAVDDLLGPAHPLSDFAQVFAASSQSETSKRFFRLA